MHLDVRPESGDDPETVVAGIIERGGRELDHEWGELPWRVFLDPRAMSSASSPTSADPAVTTTARRGRSPVATLPDMPAVTIRPRTDDDLPALGRALVGQQAASGYPHRDPLPMAPEDFIARPGTLSTWTAEVDGEPVGHAATLPVRADGREPELARLWIEGHGLPAERLGEIGVYFTSTASRGTGVGAALMRAVLADLEERDLAPCLDVVSSGAAVDYYRRAGWVTVGTTRPSWLEDDAADVIAMILPRSRS